MQTKSHPVENFLLHLVYLFTSTAAITAILTFSAQIAGVSFRVYAYLIIILCFINLGVSSIYFFRRKYGIDRIVLALLAFAVCLGLFSQFLFEPDADDYYYIPNTIYYLENPDTEMSFAVHHVYSGAEEFYSVSWASSPQVDYLKAAIAHVFNLDYLDVYYPLTIFLLGGLFPVFLYLSVYVVRGNRQKSLLAIPILIIFLLLLGDTKRSFGEFFLDRIFQPKVATIYLGIPLLTFLTYRFIHKRDNYSFLNLALALVGMLGFAFSSLVYNFLTIFLVITSFLIVNFGIKLKNYPIKEILPKLLLAVTPSLIIFVWYMTVEKIDLRSVDAVMNRGYPQTFLGHWEFVAGVGLTYTTVYLGMSFMLFLIIVLKRRMPDSKFYLVWSALTLLFLNPVSATFLIHNVTGPNIYWRLFFLLPMTAWAYEGYSFFADKLIAKGKRVYLSSGVFVLVIISSIPLLLYLPQSALHKKIELHRHNVPQAEAVLAKSIVANMEKDYPTVLAPPELAGLLPKYKAMESYRIRTNLEKLIWESREDPNFFHQINLVSDHLSAKTSGNEAVQMSFAEFPLPDYMIGYEEKFEMLKIADRYESVAESGDYSLYAKVAD